MESATWILLTDGYYIKLLFTTANDGNLHTYRAEDFEKSSDITYELLTRYKKDSDPDQELLSPASADNPAYTLSKITCFLEEKYENKSFKSLIIIAPQNVLDALEQYFSRQLLDVVVNKITGDYLNLSQDKL